MRRYLIPGLVLLVIAGVILGVVLLLNGSQPASTTLFTVRKGSISAVVRGTGKVEPARSARLSFRTGDLVKKIYVKPGDRVPAGLLLMELDDSRLQRELAGAEAQRDIARFNQSAAQERGRFQAATAPTPTASPSPTPTLPANFTPSASPPPIPPFSDQYALAKQAEQGEQNVAQARANLESAKIYAPFDGTVLTVEVNEGETVGFGTPVITYADLSNLQVRGDVDEIDVANVAPAQLVQISLDAFPGKNIEGRVASLAPSPTQRQGTTVYSAVITFTTSPTLPLRSGMAASLVITSTTKNDILLVPNRAVKTVGFRKYLSRPGQNSRSEDIPVETGLTNGEFTEIVKGINEGDQILIPK